MASMQRLAVTAVLVASCATGALAQNIEMLRGCVEGFVGADSDRYYGIEVTPGATYCFRMLGSGESDLDLWLHDINIEVLAMDVSDSPNGILVYQFDAPGTFFLRVENNEHPNGSSYTLCEGRQFEVSWCN